MAACPQQQQHPSIEEFGHGLIITRNHELLPPEFGEYIRLEDLYVRRPMMVRLLNIPALKYFNCYPQCDYEIEERIDHHQRAGDGKRDKRCHLQGGAEGSLHFEGGAAPDSFGGDEQAGDDAHLHGGLVAKDGANLFDPAADKGQTI